MANVYAINNGNWSNTSIWNTGSLPTVFDDVYSNTYTIYVDGNYKVLSVRNLSAANITRGGSFILNNGVSLSADVIGGGNSNIFCVRFLSASPSFATIFGNISANGQIANIQQSFALELSGTGTLTVYGSAAGGTNNNSGTGVSDGYIQLNAPGTLNIFGDVKGSTNGNVYYGIHNKTNGTVNVVGNVFGRNIAVGGVSHYVINNASTGTVNVTGNVVGGLDNANTGIANMSTGTVNVKGNVMGGYVNTNSYGILNNSSGTITVFGNVSGTPFSTGGAGIYSPNLNGRINVIGNVYGGFGSVGMTGNVLTTFFNVTGNVYGGSSSNVHGIQLPYASMITLYGNAYGGTGGSSAGLFLNNTTNYLPMTAIVYGNVTAGTGSSSSGITSNGGSNLGPNIVTIVGDISGVLSSGLTMNSGFAFITGNTFGSSIGGSIVGASFTSASGIIIGNSYGGVGVNASGIVLGNSSYVKLVGSCYGGLAQGANGVALQGSVDATLVVTGSAFGGAGNSSNGVIINLGTANCYISGSVVGHGRGGNDAGVWHSGTGTVLVGGYAIAGNFGNTGSGAVNNSTGILKVKRAIGNDWGFGNTLAVSEGYGVWSNAQNSQTFVEELQCGSRGQWPTRGPIYFTPNTKATSMFETDTSQNYTLIQSNSADSLLPSISSVRRGTIYNLGLSTGTCIIPPASSVALNVLVDNLSGTAVLTPTNVWNISASQITDNQSIGGRLKNTLTVSAAEKLISSFNI